MAKLFKNTKGFMVAKFTREEADALGWGYDSYTFVCMMCNDNIKGEMYYVVLLNDVMCEICYQEWLEQATYYEEDAQCEADMLERLKEQCESANVTLEHEKI